MSGRQTEQRGYRQHARRVLVVAPLLGLALAACGERQGTTDEAAVTPAISRQAATQLDQVAADITERCMRAKGWDAYSAPHMSRKELLVAEAQTKEVFGIDDVAFRKQYGSKAVRLADGSPGYVGSGDSPEDVTAPPEQSQDELDRMTNDLNGDSPFIEVKTPTSGTISMPSGGCYAEGAKKVYGPDLPGWVRSNVVVIQFNGMAANEVVKSADYQELVRKWAGCMRERGWSTVSDTGRGATKEIPDADRDRYSVDDAECGTKYDVQRSGEQMEQVAREKLYAKYEGQLLAWNEFVAAAQKRVRNLR